MKSLKEVLVEAGPMQLQPASLDSTKKERVMSMVRQMSDTEKEVLAYEILRELVKSGRKTAQAVQSSLKNLLP